MPLSTELSKILLDLFDKLYYRVSETVVLHTKLSSNCLPIYTVRGMRLLPAL